MGALNASETLEYTWENPGVAAQVTQSSAIRSDVDSVVLVILDAAGRYVYDQPLAQSASSFAAVSSSSGPWKIRVVLSGATGNISFQIRSVYCLNFHCGAGN
jgi:hypothetical protein